MSAHRRPTSVLGPRSQYSTASRGSALITVILVILVLTIVGIGISYFTQVEDRISGNDRLAKTSFYAAETGLRAGEQILALYSTTAPDPINGLLYPPPSSLAVYVPTVFTPPGGGAQAKSFRISSFESLNRSIPRTAADASNPYYLQAEYSLYVRNNVEDPGKSVGGVPDPTHPDSDNKVNLISIGRVLLAGGGGVTRVLEEQLEFTASSEAKAGQKEAWASGSGSISTGGTLVTP